MAGKGVVAEDADSRSKTATSVTGHEHVTMALRPRASTRAFGSRRARFALQFAGGIEDGAGYMLGERGWIW